VAVAAHYWWLRHGICMFVKAQLCIQLLIRSSGLDLRLFDAPDSMPWTCHCFCDTVAVVYDCITGPGTSAGPGHLPHLEAAVSTAAPYYAVEVFTSTVVAIKAVRIVLSLSFLPITRPPPAAHCIGLPFVRFIRCFQSCLS
jgi:hypothetical protein